MGLFKENMRAISLLGLEYIGVQFPCFLSVKYQYMLALL